MRFLSRNYESKVRGTARIEAWTDAVIAIIITLLVLEIQVPELEDTSVHGVLLGLREILPHIGTFAFSFLSLAVFWVNHHHFYHELDHADARLLWYNNVLLFWLSLIPFTTAFLGHYPTVPGVVMVYSFVLFMAALTFMLMMRHAMFVGDLLDPHITKEQRLEHFRHGWMGVVCYGIATLVAPWALWLSMVLIFLVPVFYVVPRLMHNHEEME